MVLNAEKRATLAEVLALCDDVAAGAGASAPAAQPTTQTIPAPASSAPISAIFLATVGASPSPTPFEKGKGVVNIASDDEEDTLDDLVLKRRRAAVAAPSHSKSSSRPASFREHPPSASSLQSLFVLEGGGENAPEPPCAPAPELPLILQQILKGYQKGVMGSSTNKAVRENLALSLSEFFAQADTFSHGTGGARSSAARSPTCCKPLRSSLLALRSSVLFARNAAISTLDATTSA